MRALEVKRWFRVLITISLPLVSLLALLMLADDQTVIEDTAQSHLGQMAPPAPSPARLCWNGVMCSQVMTGTYAATWIIEGEADDLRSIEEYSTATYEQRILSRSNNRVEVRVISKANLDTRAVFPLEKNQLPATVLPYIEPDPHQQSDDPAIVRQGQILVQGAQSEAQAVVAILEWVRANIRYDWSYSLPVDAVSVYNNGSGICSGFSNLAVALLRSAGIPARVRRGCVTWYSPHGEGHAWIESYYPDVGWVPSEPQATANFVSAGQFAASQQLGDWCGKPSTLVTLVEQVAGEFLYSLSTPYPDMIWPYFHSAHVPAWDRHPLRVVPSSLSAMLPISNPMGSWSLQIENASCSLSDWRLTAEAQWLTPNLITGSVAGTALFSIDATGMLTGSYSIPVTLYNSPREDWWPLSRTIAADLWLVDRLHQTYLPVLLAQATANQPPNEPSNPSPADGAADQSLSVNLRWTGGDPDGDSVTYDVYFEANDPTPDVLVSNDQSGATYDPGMLNANTDYFWQIKANDEHGPATAGLVWDFATGPGSVRGEMILIPAGEFQMGCDSTNSNEDCRSHEQPLHTVYLDAYRIDKYEVTNAQYRACEEAGACDPPRYNKSSTRPSYHDNPDYDDYPVIYVSWYNASDYCAWAGERLPSEAEWEKAARGSSDTRMYPWGDQAADCTLANFDAGGSTGWCIGDTSQVGDYPAGASPYGGMDMSGNVWEWVNDWWQWDYYSTSPYSNPPGPASGNSKVVRGGGWYATWDYVRVAHRISYPPHEGRVSDYGFRCAASAPGE